MEAEIEFKSTSNKKRYIENIIQHESSYNAEKFLSENYQKLEEKLDSKFKEFSSIMPPDSIYKIYSTNKQKVDYSIYSGTGGSMYVYWRYYLYTLAINENSEHNVCQESLQSFKISVDTNNYILNEFKKNKSFKAEKEPTAFFHGPIGLYTMNCICAVLTGDKERFENYLDEIIEFKQFVVGKHSEDELLYGNAGYLYALLLIKREIRLNSLRKDYNLNSGSTACTSSEAQVNELKNKNLSDLADTKENLNTENLGSKVTGSEKAKGAIAPKKLVKTQGKSTQLSSEATNFEEFFSLINPVIYDVVHFLFKIGKEKKQLYKTNFLIYPFSRIDAESDPSSLYLGGAHGVAGVLYLMLSAMQDVPNLFSNQASTEIKNEIFTSLHELIKLRSTIKSRNYPSSCKIPLKTDPKEERDSLQFCHGAPGFVHLFLAAWNFYEKNDDFLNEANELGELIWQKGILKKGFGVCHGIVGNAYCLYALFKHTKQIVWFQRFVDFLFLVFNKSVNRVVSEAEDRTRYVPGIPDTPYSLMEGVGGLVCLMAEFLATLVSRSNGIDFDYVAFPGYEV